MKKMFLLAGLALSVSHAWADDNPFRTPQQERRGRDHMTTRAPRRGLDFGAQLTLAQAMFADIADELRGFMQSAETLLPGQNLTVLSFADLLESIAPELRTMTKFALVGAHSRITAKIVQIHASAATPADADASVARFKEYKEVALIRRWATEL